MLFAVAMLGCAREWRQAEALRAELRCGMTQQEVGDLARGLRAEIVGCPAPADYSVNECYVEHGKTHFQFFFAPNGGLRTVARGHGLGLTRNERSQAS